MAYREFPTAKKKRGVARNGVGKLMGELAGTPGRESTPLTPHLTRLSLRGSLPAPRRKDRLQRVLQRTRPPANAVNKASFSSLHRNVPRALRHPFDNHYYATTEIFGGISRRKLALSKPVPFGAGFIRKRNSPMSKKAAASHKKAAEHHKKAAEHHDHAATHHEAGHHEKAAHHAHTAEGHQTHATKHAGDAAAHHAEEHGAK